MIYKLDSSGLKSVSPGVNILEKNTLMAHVHQFTH